MRELSDATVAQWGVANNTRVPTAVDTVCPHCERQITFTPSWIRPADQHVVHSTPRCPGCGQNVLLLLVELRQDSASQRRGRLFIFPANPVRQPLKGIDESAELSEGLKRAYLSALSVYNHRDWSATAVSCRRVLEGLTKSLLPQELHDLPLASQIEQLPERADLARPILTLARSLKEGGNLGAHFDLDREPNEHVARLMVDLLDDLIEYLFVLPRRIEELNQRIARSGRSATAPPSVGEVGA